MISSLIAFGALLTACLANPVASGAQPLPPSRDPFYTAPPNFQDAAPGTVLRMRPAPGNLTQVAGKNCSASYNVLFRTTDSHYKPSWAVTTLFVPSSPSHLANATCPPLVSYQIPYNSPDVDASPSYASYTGLIPDIPNLLGLGWVVNVPDFEGPLASFVAGVESGHATLDSIRAVRSASQLGLADSTVAMWGYSGGSFASEFAAELQEQYAPELKISGVALGGLVSNVTSILPTTNGTQFAGLIPSLLLGLSNQYPALRQYLDDRLKTSGPYNKTGFLSALGRDVGGNFAYYYNQDIFAYFKGGLADVVSPTVLEYLNRESVLGGHGVPQMPLFIYKAIGDEITPIEDTDEQAAQYCKYGARIEYRRNTVGGHVAEITNGDQHAVAWLADVFNGKKAPRGCDIQNVTWNITTSENLSTPGSGAGN